MMRIFSRHSRLNWRNREAMKDTNGIEILPYDEAEILDGENSLPRLGLRVVGLSSSRKVVTLGLLDNEGRVTRYVERAPQRVLIRLVTCDPRLGVIYPSGKTMDEMREYLKVIQAYMKKRAGEFDEWLAPGVRNQPAGEMIASAVS